MLASRGKPGSQGWAQQEDPLPVPHLLQDVRGVVRAEAALRQEALGGGEAACLQEVWEAVSHRGGCARPREAVRGACPLHLWDEIRFQV